MDNSLIREIKLQHGIHFVFVVVVSFAVCVANRYKQNKTLRKLLTKKASLQNSYAFESAISQAKVGTWFYIESSNIGIVTHHNGFNFCDSM